MSQTKFRFHKPSLYDAANVFSRLWMLYIIPLLSKAMKNNGLRIGDLDKCPKQLKVENIIEKLEQNWSREKCMKCPSFGKTLFRTYGKCFILPYIFKSFNELFLQIVRPLLLSRVIRYFSEQSQITYLDACLSALGVCLSTLLIVLIDYPCFQEAMERSIEIKSAISALIYRKAIKLNQTSLQRTQVGKIINLLSNDMKRIDSNAYTFVYIPISPIQSVITVYILWQYLGVASLAGVAILVLLIPLQAKTSRIAASFRSGVAKLTDSRLRFMNEIISGTRVIKMYCWEKPFGERVDRTRKQEISQIRKSYYWKALNMSIFSSATRLVLFVCFVVYIYLNNALSAEAVFVSMALFNRVRMTLTNLFPQAIGAFKELRISLGRIEKFLLLEEIADKNKINEIKQEMKYLGNPFIQVNNIAAKWNKDDLKPVLRDISFELKPGDLLAVIGPVGSGKSSLLLSLLNELPLESGEIKRKGALSYAAQDCWSFNDSIRNNILFGLKFDAEKYQKVIQVCALEGDFKLMPFGDQTLVGEKGVQLSGGQKARMTLARAVYRDSDLVLLDDPLSAVDASVAKHIFDKCIIEHLESKIRILVTHQIQFIEKATKVLILKDGQCLAYGTYQQVHQSGIDFVDLLMNNRKEDQINDNLQNEKIINLEKVYEKVLLQQPKEEEQAQLGSVRNKVYWEYFRAGANGCMLVIFGCFIVISQAIFHATDIFLSYWTNQVNDPSHNTVDVIIYSTLVFSMFLTMIIRDISFFAICMRASVRLHNQIFTRLMRVPVAFFDTNPSGQILNRFSKDIGNIDESIPESASNLFIYIAQFFGVIITITIVQWILLLPGLILLVIVIYLREIFLKASRDINRFDGITRSPIYSHVTTSMDGIVSIRGFGAQNNMEKQFDCYLNDNCSTLFLLLGTNNLMSMTMELCSAIYISIITAVVIVSKDMAGGTAGLIITSGILMAGTLHWGVRTSAQFESQMTSVERVVEYQSLKQEEELIKLPKMSKQWPTKGEIQFDHVSLSYGKDKPVLRDIDCTIYDGEKIGIVGRTGAGKSSLIAALFRLTQTSGIIRIDGVDIESIGLKDLRSIISIIPQDPVIFSGTVRYNLDPFGEYPDSELWSALENVQLKPQVDNFAGKLDAELSESGANLSVGQRQLICLARALLRRNRILILDEATANVDHQTDQLIQQTIRSQFASCTVITIAHRLHTVIDSDRVMLIEAGEVKEFDSPYQLLNQQGPFYDMCLKTGQNMFPRLYELAKEAQHIKT